MSKKNNKSSHFKKLKLAESFDIFAWKITEYIFNIIKKPIVAALETIIHQICQNTSQIRTIWTTVYNRSYTLLLFSLQRHWRSEDWTLPNWATVWTLSVSRFQTCMTTVLLPLLNHVTHRWFHASHRNRLAGDLNCDYNNGTTETQNAVLLTFSCSDTKDPWNVLLCVCHETH